MIADLDTLLTALHVELTDRIIPSPGLARSGPGKPPEVTDAELERSALRTSTVPGGATAVPSAPATSDATYRSWRFMPHRDACLLHVCSDVPVRPGSGRHHAAPGLPVCRTARHVIAWPGTTRR